MIEILKRNMKYYSELRKYVNLKVKCKYLY